MYEGTKLVSFENIRYRLNVEYEGLNTYIEINCILKSIENIIISNCDITLYITGHSKSEQPNITQIVGQLNN